MSLGKQYLWGIKRQKVKDGKCLQIQINQSFYQLKTRKNLNYETTLYTSFNSYTRKNIGYLYAIEHGAKEIYEADDDNIFTTFNKLYNQFNFSKVCNAENNKTTMMNPYAYFGRPTVRPCGFKLDDIGTDWYNKFYFNF